MSTYQEEEGVVGGVDEQGGFAGVEREGESEGADEGEGADRGKRREEEEGVVVGDIQGEVVEVVDKNSYLGTKLRQVTVSQIFTCRISHTNS